MEYNKILAIIPANQDLVNSESLRIAKIVDPKGERTLGILTKLDLMDQGTNAREIILNKKLPLKLGYIPVVNRGQKDLNKSLSYSIQKEIHFFKNHQAYQDLSQYCGNQFLI